VELALSPSPGIKGEAIFPLVLLVHRKSISGTDSSKNYNYGAAGAPDYGSVYLKKISTKTTFL
jgi:hypothetical protein